MGIITHECMRSALHYRIYINSVIDGNRISVQIGTGNEGDGIGQLTE